MHEPLLGSSRNKARLLGSSVKQLLDVLHVGTSTKNQPNNFLDSLEICRLRQQQCLIRVPLHLCCDSVCSTDGQGCASGPCSPGRALLPSKGGPCCRMRPLFITRESKLSIDLSCWSRRQDEAGAGCSMGHE